MNTIRSRFSDGKATGCGMHPDDLWGAGRGPRKRQRGAEACARRKAKRAAKAAGVTLKSYLRKQAKAAKR